MTIRMLYDLTNELRHEIQPVVTGFAVISEKLDNHSVSINSKVDGMYSHFDSRLTSQEAQINNLVKVIEQYQNDRKIAKIALSTAGAIIGSALAMFYQYRDKAAAILSTILK